MPGFATALSFIDGFEKVVSVEELERQVDAATLELGFDYFALVQHVDLSTRETGNIIAISTYPSDWAASYISRRIVNDDPIHLASHRTNVGFLWHDAGKYINLTTAHRRIREETVRAGLEDGFTVPANIPGEITGSCTFAVRTGHPVPVRHLLLAQMVGSYAFQAARRIVRTGSGAAVPAVRLTPRQLECIALMARGKTDWEIARILGLKEDTVTEYIDEARRRFGFLRRQQLIAYAAYSCQLALSDMVG